MGFSSMVLLAASIGSAVLTGNAHITLWVTGLACVAFTMIGVVPIWVSLYCAAVTFFTWMAWKLWVRD